MNPDVSRQFDVAGERRMVLPQILLRAIKTEVQRMSADTGIGVHELQIIMRGPEEKNKGVGKLLGSAQEQSFIMNVASNNETRCVKVMELTSQLSEGLKDGELVDQENDICNMGEKREGRSPNNGKAPNDFKTIVAKSNIETECCTTKLDTDISIVQATPQKKRDRQPERRMVSHFEVSDKPVGPALVSEYIVTSRRSGRVPKPKIFFDGSSCNIIGSLTKNSKYDIVQQEHKSNNRANRNIYGQTQGIDKLCETEKMCLSSEDNLNSNRNEKMNMSSEKKRGHLRKHTEAIRNLSNDTSHKVSPGVIHEMKSDHISSYHEVTSKRKVRKSGKVRDGHYKDQDRDLYENGNDKNFENTSHYDDVDVDDFIDDDDNVSCQTPKPKKYTHKDVKKNKRKKKDIHRDKIKSKANVKNNYVCSECGKILQTRSSLCNHRQIHKKLKEHICDHCSKEFTQRGNLQKHISSVHKFMKPFLCSLCGSRFTQQSGLDYHMKAHRYNKSMREIGSITGLGCNLDGTDKTQVRCLFCSDVFINVLRYLHHLEHHLKKEMKYSEPYELDEGKKQLAQDILEKQKSLLKNEKIYKCDRCDKIFWMRGMLNEHLQTHLNADGQLYKCKYCDENFGSSSTRNNHQRIHTDKYPFICKQCDKRFTHQYQLRHHISTYHSTSGNGMSVRTLKGTVVRSKHTFSCTQCSKVFGSVYNMNVHLRTHKKERPFQCVVCKNTFTDPSNLIAHGKRHHPNYPKGLFTSSVKKLRQLRSEGILQNGEIHAELDKSFISQTPDKKETIVDSSVDQSQELVQQKLSVSVANPANEIVQSILEMKQPESVEVKAAEVEFQSQSNLFLISNSESAILSKPEESEDNITLVEYQIDWI